MEIYKTGSAERLLIEEDKHMHSNIMTILDAMQIRETRFSAGAADAFMMMKGWCGLDDSEGQQLKEPGREPEKMDAIAQLATGVAHEFNNILTVILLNAEMLGDLLGKENERVQTVIRATSRGAELTQQLLAFSRRQRLNPRVLDLGTLAEAMIDRPMQTLGEKIKMELRQAPDLWPVVADPLQLENVFLNLANNARDAMPLGGRLVIELANFRLGPKHAATQPGLVPGDYVVLKVSDTGRGIAPDVLERVFEPFFTTKDVGEGAGLGLSRVYGFARQSGGHVAIDSELGRGTTVTLYLPRATGNSEGGHARESA